MVFCDNMGLYNATGLFNNDLMMCWSLAINAFGDKKFTAQCRKSNSERVWTNLKYKEYFLNFSLGNTGTVDRSSGGTSGVAEIPMRATFF